MIPSAEAFQVAAKAGIERLGRGWKTKIAKKLDIRPQYLSDLLAGRKAWTDPLRDKLAEALGTSVAGIIIVGEMIIEHKASKPRRKRATTRAYPVRRK